MKKKWPKRFMLDRITFINVLQKNMCVLPNKMYISVYRNMTYIVLYCFWKEFINLNKNISTFSNISTILCSFTSSC